MQIGQCFCLWHPIWSGPCFKHTCHVHAPSGSSPPRIPLLSSPRPHQASLMLVQTPALVIHPRPGKKSVRCRVCWSLTNFDCIVRRWEVGGN